MAHLHTSHPESSLPPELPHRRGLVMQVSPCLHGPGRQNFCGRQPSSHWTRSGASVSPSSGARGLRVGRAA
eukprot:scaffold40729_cov33-Phaeocystis_antarctica.AAC.1